MYGVSSTPGVGGLTSLLDDLHVFILSLAAVSAFVLSFSTSLMLLDVVSIAGSSLRLGDLVPDLRRSLPGCGDCVCDGGVLYRTIVAGSSPLDGSDAGSDNE